MGAQELEKEAFEPPMINPWRQAPSREQVRYATDLCRSELRTPQPTIDTLPGLSRHEMTGLIDGLKEMRAKRLRKAPRPGRRNWRLAPMTRRR